MRICVATLLFLRLDDYWIGAHGRRPDSHDGEISKLEESEDESSDHRPFRSELFQQGSGSEVGEWGLGVSSPLVLGSSLLSLNSSSRSNSHEQSGGHATEKETASSAVQQVHILGEALTGTHRSHISLFNLMSNGLMRLADRNFEHDSITLSFALCVGAGCAVIFVMVCCYVRQAGNSKPLRGSSTYTGHYQRVNSYTAARLQRYQKPNKDWNDPETSLRE